MTHALTAHEEYIIRYGFSRWVLRECVRANPLYVISAAFLSYGVMLLNTEIDPQIGKTRGIVLSLLLLHVYEFALLGAATFVLKQRSTGGDLHGLTLVAALFMGGSFLALDELITIWRPLAFVLVPVALLLAYMKLAWYARLPGIFLPLRHRNVGLAVLAGHSVTVLLGASEHQPSYDTQAAQGFAWLSGWLTLLPVFWLIRHEGPQRTPSKGDRTDPLASGWCGAWMLIMFMVTSLAHLYSADWIFDRPYNSGLLLPWLTMLAGLTLLLRWQWGIRTGIVTCSLIGVPALAAHWFWITRMPALNQLTMDVWLTPAMQLCLAGIVFYCGMAWATQRSAFGFGLLGPLSAPLWSVRQFIPHFRALLSVAAGFVVLVCGMVLSFYRERLLKWLDPERPKPVIQPGESLP